MRLFRFYALSRAETTGRTRSVALGAFDGIHLGHQALLHQLRADQTRTMITFSPLPGEFFRIPIQRLMSVRDKISFLQQKEWIDELWLLPFNQKLAQQTAEQFIEQTLIQSLNTQHLVIGDDFRFGRQAKGDFRLLKQYADQGFFELEEQATICDHALRISSSRVRKALSTADVVQANKLLGRNYCISGKVRYGQQLARTFGFPTANIELWPHIAPAFGVYFVQVKGMAGIANIGLRPTVGGFSLPRLEVHLLDRSLHLYDRYVTVEFLDFLRPEQKFSSLDQLQQQIQQDVQQAHLFFKQQNITEELHFDQKIKNSTI